jgi:hypothetical protein
MAQAFRRAFSSHAQRKIRNYDVSVGTSFSDDKGHS